MPARPNFRNTGPSLLTTTAFLVAMLGTAGGSRVAIAQEGEPQPFRFVVVGDTRTDGAETSVNWDVLTQRVVDMNTHHPSFGRIGHSSWVLA